MSNKEENKDTVLGFLANQLLSEVTFAQVFEMVKFQCFKQAEETFSEMSEAEVQTISDQVTKSEAEAAASRAQAEAANVKDTTPEEVQDIVSSADKDIVL